MFYFCYGISLDKPESNASCIPLSRSAVEQKQLLNKHNHQVEVTKYIFPSSSRVYTELMYKYRQ